MTNLTIYKKVTKLDLHFLSDLVTFVVLFCQSTMKISRANQKLRRLESWEEIKNCRVYRVNIDTCNCYVFIDVLSCQSSSNFLGMDCIASRENV